MRVGHFDSGHLDEVRGLDYDGGTSSDGSMWGVDGAMELTLVEIIALEAEAGNRRTVVGTGCVVGYH